MLGFSKKWHYWVHHMLRGVHKVAARLNMEMKILTEVVKAKEIIDCSRELAETLLK